MTSIARELVKGDHIEILPSEPGRLMDNKNGGVPIPGLPAPSIGHVVGVSLCFLGDTDLWGHELGHCRYFQHAGNAPGRAEAQHDCTGNLAANWGDPFARETSESNQKWDRTCLMSYVTDLSSYDDYKDMPCFCFKCVLKNRGWKLNDATVPVPSPPGDLQDP